MSKTILFLCSSPRTVGNTNTVAGWVKHGATAAGADEAAWFARLDEVTDFLATSRPTAVNLFWALKRMKKVATDLRGTKPPDEIAADLLAEAMAIHEEDRRTCRAIGAHGAELLRDGDGVLTHCNAGGLATSDYGTALAVFFAAATAGKRLHIYADETRPLLQGARLTAWELKQACASTVVISTASTRWTTSVDVPTSTTTM